MRHFVVDNVIEEANEVSTAHSWGWGDLDHDGWSDVVVRGYDDTWYFTPFNDIPWTEDRYW